MLEKNQGFEGLNRVFCQASGNMINILKKLVDTHLRRRNRVFDTPKRVSLNELHINCRDVSGVTVHSDTSLTNKKHANASLFYGL